MRRRNPQPRRRSTTTRGDRAADPASSGSEDPCSVPVKEQAAGAAVAVPDSPAGPVGRPQRVENYRVPHSTASAACSVNEHVDEQAAAVAKQTPRTDSDRTPSASIYERLPAPLRAVIGFLYLDGVKPEDDFLTRLQKLLLATGVCIAPCTATYISINVWHIEANEGGYSTVGDYVHTVFDYLMFCVWLVCFAVHKLAPSVPIELVSGSWVLGTYVCLLMLTLSYPDYPCPHMFVQLAMLALSLRSRFGYSIVGASALTYLIAAYNEAAHLPATATETLRLATVPDPYRYTTFWQRFRGQANEYAVYVIIFACLELQMREAGRLTAASRASAELAAELAHALSRYDTAAAARRLEEARAAAQGKGDAGLLDAFEAIVDNLNSYRPHLPNWLLPRNCSSSADGEGGEPESEGSLGLSDSALNRSGHSNASRQSQLTCTTLASHAGDGETIAKSVRVVLFRAGFEFGFGDAPPPLPGLRAAEFSRTDYAAAAHAFVDRVFALADRAAGAVHTFVGDQLLVSWNAAAPAVQPEVKAARFVHKLGDDAGHAAVRVCGVASAFAAHVVMAGTAQQRSLALSAARAGGDTFAERAQRLAARFGALLVDGRIWRAANHAMEFRGAGIIDMAQPFQSNYGRPATAARLGPSVDPVFQQRVARNSEPRLSVLRPVFEVVGEQAETNDEWLYVLQQQQQELDAHAGAAARPNATLCSAVTALSEGKRDVALKLLDIAKSSDAARRPIVAALLEEHGITS